VLLATLLSAWIQYGADGAAHARTISTGAHCPVVLVDGHAARGVQRAAPDAAYTERVCDAPLPAGAQRIVVAGRALPHPAHDPNRIIVLGDTGCRVKGFFAVQACDDPVRWPFPRVAREIAAQHPDLIVHVGDYLYRETACPRFRSGCRGTPHGDGTAAWRADFFTPAAPMFAAAPLLLVRGNHEECRRNGRGWYRYLGVRAAVACADEEMPFAVDLGTLRLVDFDSAVAEDIGISDKHADTYRPEFARARALAAGARDAWFVTHRPPYLNRDERDAMGTTLTGFEAVLAGHVHLFGAMNVGDLPPLLVNGEGGTALDPDIDDVFGITTGHLPVRRPVFISSHHGFAIYTRVRGGWDLSLRDPDGRERAQCTLRKGNVHCFEDRAG